MLSGPDGPTDAVTWGLEGASLDMPLSCGAPLMPVRGFYTAAESIHMPGDVLIRLPASLAASESNPVRSEFWQYRLQHAATPGLYNPLPQPVHFSPSDGTEVASNCTFYVDGFEWSTHTTFQFSSDPGFASVALESTVEGASLWEDSLEAGTWYWRVRGYSAYPDDPGPWSVPTRVIREPYDIDVMIANLDKQANSAKTLKANPSTGPVLIASSQVLTVQKCQRKDTTMLCLDGCDIEGRCPWCDAHANDFHCRHGRMYCTRCSVSMMASAGGRTLSQDRITYYLFEEAGTQSRAAMATHHLDDPYGDLGHNVGTRSEDCPLLVSWLYGQDKSASKEVFYHDKIFYDESPEMDSFNDDPMDQSVFDGCEDANKDGLLDPFGRESDCFVLADDFEAVNPDCFRGTIKIRQVFDIDIPMEGFDLFNDMEESIVIGNAPLDSSDYSHDHFWSRLYRVEDTGAYKADGDSTLRGHAMVKLEQDPTTKIYSITTDVDTVNEDFNWDNQFPGVGGISIGWNPTVFFFKGTEEFGNPRFEIDEAFECDGGLKLQGETDLYQQAGMDTPFSTLTLTWDIWISPPSE